MASSLARIARDDRAGLVSHSVHERFHHVRKDEKHSLRLVGAVALLLGARNHLPERVLQRVLEAVGALRHGGRNDLVQLRVFGVHVHQPFDELAREVLERSRGAVGHRLLDHLPHIVDVAVIKGGEDRPLVGEVLIERPDADAGCLRDAIRGDGLGAVTLHHTLDRLEHGLHGLPRALLLRLAPRERFFVGLVVVRVKTVRWMLTDGWSQTGGASRRVSPGRGPKAPGNRGPARLTRGPKAPGKSRAGAVNGRQLISRHPAERLWPDDLERSPNCRCESDFDFRSREGAIEISTSSTSPSR